MKAILALCFALVAVTTQASTKSFKQEIISVFSSGTLTQESEVRWIDIIYNGSKFVALLESEMKDLTYNEQAELMHERADQLCRWMGLESSTNFGTRGRHQIYKFENSWFQLSQNAGDYPERSDLVIVHITPNAQIVSGSIISSMLKIDTAKGVTLRSSSPLSFESISCSR